VIFQGRSEKEIMLASEELRRTRSCHSQQVHVTATKLAMFLESVEAHEALLQQRLADTESVSMRGSHPNLAANKSRQDHPGILALSAKSRTAASRKSELYEEL